MADSSSLSIVIDDTSKVSKYLQLQNSIEKLVLQGRLKPQQKLPSSRELAQVLGISRTSVLRAIDNLIAEGVLVSRPKQGVFVAKYQPQLSRAVAVKDHSNAKRPLQNAPVLAFDSGADTAVFPNLNWAKCMKRAWISPDLAVMDGRYEDGVPGLKAQICHYLGQLRGLQCKPSQIVIAAGNRDCLSIICHALIPEPSHQVFLEQVCYPQIPALIQFLKHSIKALNIDQQGACLPTDINLQNNLAILTPCRQYPLGLSMSSIRRQEWLDLLNTQKQQDKSLWLVEDDYDNEFAYQGRVNVPLMQQDTSDSVFFVGSFSKVLFKGLRLSFIVSPEKHVAKIIASQKALGATCSTALQPVLTEFIASGMFATHLRKMRRHYSQKRDFVLSRLSVLAPYFEWQNVSGGMHICLTLKPVYCHLEGEIVKRANAQGLQLNSLSKHYLDEHRAYGVLLGFSKASLEHLGLGLDILRAVTKDVCEGNR